MAADELASGTLVRVRDIVLVSVPERLLHAGTLWLVIGPDTDPAHYPDSNPDPLLYRCRSLATGQEYLWYPFEVEHNNE